jgi:hypothetical protein
LEVNISCPRRKMKVLIESGKSFGVRKPPEGRFEGDQVRIPARRGDAKFGWAPALSPLGSVKAASGRRGTQQRLAAGVGTEES